MGILRFLLAISVVLAHSYSFFRINLLGGPLAVQAFFIISGFYMSLILNEKYLDQPGSYKLFITNRFMRIYPIYVIVLLVTVLFSVFSYYYPLGLVEEKSLFVNTFGMYMKYDDIHPLTICFLLFSNLVIFLQDVVMFLGVDPSNGDLFYTSNFRLTDPQLYKFLFIPQAWTVALELMFYLIAPYFVRRNIKLLAGIILGTFVIRFIAYNNGLENDPWNYRFFPFELGYFLMGSLSYYLYKKIRVKNLNTYLFWGAFGLMTFVTITYPVIKFQNSEYVYCILFAICLPFIFHLTKTWKYDTYIGDLSYPIYLVHVFILAVVKYFSDYIPKGVIGIVFLIGVIGFSITLNEVISKRIEKIRQRRVREAGKKGPGGAIRIDPAIAQ